MPATAAPRGLHSAPPGSAWTRTILRRTSCAWSEHNKETGYERTRSRAVGRDVEGAPLDAAVADRAGRRLRSAGRGALHADPQGSGLGQTVGVDHGQGADARGNGGLADLR